MDDPNFESAMLIIKERDAIIERLRADLEEAKKPVVFVTADYFPGPQLRCTVQGPQHIIVERVDEQSVDGKS